MVSPQNASDGRGRLLLIAGSATVAGLLAVGLVVYLLLPSALSVDYERYEGDWGSVDHPRGWEVREESEPHASWGTVLFLAPEGDEDFPETAMAVGWYDGPTHEDAATEAVEAWNEAAAELGFEDWDQEELDPADYVEVPGGWDAAMFEDAYTGLDNTAEMLDWEETRRFSLSLQFHVAEAEGTTAYWIAWYGPQSERRTYDRVVHETLESFAPRP